MRISCATFICIGLLHHATVLADDVLDEIIVTATKRAERVQDVPISIAVVSGDVVRQDALLDLRQLSTRIANFSVSEGPVTDNIFVRGIGSGSERSFEQSVALFADDVYMPRSRQYRLSFLDVELVEVARGPQAVSYGLNASAGAVAVHTARSRPGDPFFAEILSEYEAEYGGYAFSLVAGGSPNESLGLRFAAKTLDSGDGYWDNLATGDSENTRSDDMFRGSLVWKATSDLTIDLKLEYAEFGIDGNINELYTAAGAYSDGSDVLDWVRGQDGSLLPLFKTPRAPGYYGHLFIAAASVEYEVGQSAFEAIVGFTDYESDLFSDADGSPAQGIDLGFAETYEQTSLELRYRSPGGRRLEYVVGAYFHAGSLANEQPTLVDGEFFLAPLGFPIDGFDAGRLWSNVAFDQDEDVYSLFGLLTWNITDDLQMRGGLRYTRSDKLHERGGECEVRREDGSYEMLDPTGNPNDALLISIGLCPTVIEPPVQERESDNVLPELSLHWFASDSVSVYGKVSSGAKSGGFVASTVVIPGTFEYGDETALGIEFGLKSSLLRNSLFMNAAVFRTEYDDLQVNSFDPDTGAAIINNAGSSTAQGVEVDIAWAATEWLTAGASVAYLDAEFESFPVGPCYAGEPTNPGGIGCDKSGMPLPNAPRFNGNVFLDVDAPLARSTRFLAGINATFSDDFLTNGSLDPIARQSSCSIFDIRVGIGSADQRWDVSLIGKNVTDEVINNFTGPFLNVNRGLILPPRTTWLQGRLRWGGRASP